MDHEIDGEGKMDRVLLESREDGVLTLTMNRPDRLNALNPDMLQSLHDALTRAAADREIGVIVLTGAGRAFGAGGDVKAMAEGGRSETFDERAQGLRQRMEVSRLLHEIPKPTIAMLRGAAAGAGLSLALACDLRVASDTARLTTAFAKVALSGDFGGSYFLTRLVGPAKARELYFTSPILGAAEAQALGLVSRVVADAELEGATRSLALSLARGPRVTLGYMKQNMNLAERGGLAEVMDAEALRHTRCAQTEDHREAAQAFVEKRAPVFKGR
ncbi:MAG TPA: enoyl-CoA hydratase [Stellaceae bacterium]